MDCNHGNMLDFDAPPVSLDPITFFDVATPLGRDPFPAVLTHIGAALAPGGVLAFREPAMPIVPGSHDRAVDVRKCLAEKPDSNRSGSPT